MDWMICRGSFQTPLWWDSVNAFPVNSNCSPALPAMFNYRIFSSVETSLKLSFVFSFINQGRGRALISSRFWWHTQFCGSQAVWLGSARSLCPARQPQGRGAGGVSAAPRRALGCAGGRLPGRLQQLGRERAGFVRWFRNLSPDETVTAANDTGKSRVGTLCRGGDSVAVLRGPGSEQPELAAADVRGQACGRGRERRRRAAPGAASSARGSGAPPRPLPA